MFLERYRKVRYPPGETCTPIIDPEKCKGCNFCEEICPSGAIEVKDKLARPVYLSIPDRQAMCPCMGCRNCVSVCKHNAITIKGSMVIYEGRYKSVYQSRPISYPAPLGEGQDYEGISGKLTDVEKVIYRRRSNRIFKRDRVPRELIHRLLEAARYAPSAGNCQPVRFIVIDDPELIDEIRKSITHTLKKIMRMYISWGLIGRIFTWFISMFKPGMVDIRPIYGIRSFTGGSSKLDILHFTPVLILLLGDKRGVGKYQLDCGIAAEHIILTAHALGLGTCYVGLIEPLNMDASLKKKLNIRWPYKVVTSICVGYPKINQDRVVEREVTPVDWYPPFRGL